MTLTKTEYFYITQYDLIDSFKIGDDNGIDVLKLKKAKNLFETRTEAEDSLLSRLAFRQLQHLKIFLTKGKYRKFERYIIADNLECIGEPSYKPIEIKMLCERNSGLVLWDYETACKACDLLNSRKYIIDHGYLIKEEENDN